MTTQADVDKVGRDEVAKMLSAGMRVNAKLLELDAWLAVGDWPKVEKTRQELVSLYEQMIDAKIMAVRVIAQAIEDLPK